MALISDSMKKINQKKEEFRLKMMELRNLDATDITNTSVTSDPDDNVLDCSFDANCDLDNTLTTVPKLAYDPSKDIVFNAFINSEVLQHCPTPPTANFNHT